MKRLFIAALAAVLSLPALAQQPTMASLFKAMPDSLLPYLSRNNRLDMLDFMEAHMKAEVTNLLDGTSRMTYLSADSLSISMSASLRVEMKVVELEEPADSSRWAVRVRRTYCINENQTESIADVYTSVWRCLSSSLEQSSLLKRDEDVILRRRSDL